MVECLKSTCNGSKEVCRVIDFGVAVVDVLVGNVSFVTVELVVDPVPEVQGEE